MKKILKQLYNTTQLNDKKTNNQIVMLYRCIHDHRPILRN